MLIPEEWFSLCEAGSVLAAPPRVIGDAASAEEVAGIRRSMWANGYRPVPIKTRQKAPAGVGWTRDARRDPPPCAAPSARVERHALGTGVLTDGIRIVDIDVDDAGIVDHIVALATEMFGTAPLRYRDGSPRVALLYRAAEGTPSKLAMRGEAGAIEVLGLGQQLVVSGIHPSGAEYAWRDGSPWDTPLEDLRALTEDQIATFMQAAAPLIGSAFVPGAAPRAEGRREPSAPPKRSHDGGSFWRAVNELALTNLEAWVPALFPRAKFQPGTRAFRITSRMLGRNLQEDLSIAPTGIQDFGEEKSMTACDVVLEHGGAPELKDASFWLCERLGIAPESLGWDELEPITSADVEAGNRIFADRLGIVDEPGSAATPWGPLDLSILDSGRRNAPIFDASVLGPELSEWAQTTAKATSAPIDYVAVSLLALASATIANVRWPKAGSAWSEPPLIWACLVGNPSAGKSPAMSAVLSAIRPAEDRMSADYENSLKQFEADSLVAEMAHEQWRKNMTILAESGEVGCIQPPPDEADKVERPVRKRIVIGDSTTEMAALIAAAQQRGLLMARDELAGWLLSFGRYGNDSDRAFALESYGGRGYTVDRVKNPIPIKIRHLSIGVLGGIQPDRIAEALRGADDGLPSRFLFAWPDTLPEFSLHRGREPSDVAVQAMGRLVALPMSYDEYDNPEPTLVPLERQAEDALEAFARRVGIRAAKATGLMAGSLGKARGHVLRLAAVLEFLWWASGRGGQPPEFISAEAVKAAVELVENYFLPMAERVFGDAAIPIEELNATTLARHLRTKRLAEFNAYAVRREIGGALREADAMNAACEALVDSNIIRPRATARKLGRGRPPKAYEVNPALAAG